MVSTFIIIILQATVFMAGTTLMLLGGRSNYTVVPALDWRRYVETSVAGGAEQDGVGVMKAGGQDKANE